MVDAKAESLEHCSTMHLRSELRFENIHDVGITRARQLASPPHAHLLIDSALTATSLSQ